MRILKSSLFFILCSLGITAQVSNSEHLQDGCSTAFQERYYQQVFSETPSMLSHWKTTDWSYISLSYFKDKGDFRNPQLYSKSAGLKLKTASIVKLSKSDWTFYGAFEYQHKVADSVRGNLSYYIQRNESPYYLFMKKSGNWNLQNYQFNVTATKQLLAQKLALGLNVKYKVLMAFRTIDTRNNQTSLDVESTVSGTYAVSKNNSWSLGLKYSTKKTKSKLSNKYQHATQGLDYNLYLNAGLGTYLKNIPFGLLTEEAEIGGLLQWTKNTKNNRYSVYVDTGFGTENWTDETIVSVAKNQKITQYKYSKQRLKATYIHAFTQGYFSSNLQGVFTVGTGKLWHIKQQEYVQNYKANCFRVQTSNKVFFKNKILHAVGLFLGYDNSDNLDKNYNYIFRYSNYMYGPNVSFLSLINGRNLETTMAAIYHKNIDFSHQPNAAKDNLYTSWVAGPRGDYLSADYIKYQASIRYTTEFEKQRIVFLLAGSYDRPSLKQALNSMYTKTDFLSLDASIRLYF